MRIASHGACRLWVKSDHQEPEAPAGESALALLQAVYRDPRQPLSVRMRAAIEALLFESPKLTATAVLTREDFAERLERATARSLAAKLNLIEAESIRSVKKRPPTKATSNFPLLGDIGWETQYASPAQRIVRILVTQ
jgi:hypothetical protein